MGGRRRFVIWTISIAVLVPVLIIGLVASQRKVTTTDTPGPWLVIHMQEPADTLNPIVSKDAYASAVNGNIFDRLLRQDPETLDLVPDCAEAMPEISKDKKVFTFRLRKGIMWQNDDNELTPQNVEMTADDIVFSFNTVMDNDVDCQPSRSYLADVEKCEKLDRYTVRFTTRTVNWRWVVNLGSMTIIPKHIYGYPNGKGRLFNVSRFNNKPIGNGPYRFGKWERGQKLTLVRNENYWNKARMPRIPCLVYKFVKDPTAAMELVKKKEIDRYVPSAEQWFRDAVESTVLDHYRRFKYNSLGYNYIGWNPSNDLFKNKYVRRAMTHAFPREEFLKTRMYNLGIVATGPFHAVLDANDKSIKPWAYDLDESRRLLEEAGWVDTNGNGIRDKDGREFTFRLLFPSGRPIYRDMALTLKENLAKVGVSVSLRSLDWGSFLAELEKRNFDAITLGWTGSVFIDPYQIWHSKEDRPSGSNFIHYHNSDVDRIIEQARETFDVKARTKLFHEFHAIMHDEQPYTFLYYRPALVLVHRRFENIKQYPLGLEDREWWVKPRNLIYGVTD